MDPETLDDIPPTEREVDADETLMEAPELVPDDDEASEEEEEGDEDEDDLI